MKKQLYIIVLTAFLFTTIFSIDTSNYTLADSGPSPSPSPTPLADFMVIASAGPGGTITPSGGMFTTPGESHSFTITPNAGYQILDVVDNGVSQGAISTYSLPDIHGNHEIEATFTPTTDNTLIITIAAIAIAVIVAIAAALILSSRRKK